MKIKRAIVAIASLFGICTAFGATVDATSAKEAVAGWIALGESLGDGFNGATIDNVTAYEGEGGKGVFYCVSLSGGGYVLTTSDTMLTPVAAYSPEGTFEATDENPLYVLMKADAAARAARLEATASASQTGRAGAGAAATTPNQAAWARLKSAGGAKTGRAGAGSSTSSPSTIIVSPLLTTKWGQQESYGYCYNYYTPNHYPCGCVATAGAQVLKYFAWPKTDVEARTFPCTVDKVSTNLTMIGGTYTWSKMVTTPSSEGNRMEVGKLCYDVGVSVGMSYTSSGSGAVGFLLANSFTNVFGYSNACFLPNASVLTRQVFEKTILCNLYAKRPCILSITGRPTGSETSDVGHAIVADGYGLSDTTAYTHLNMGWSGTSDTWYTPVWADETTGLADINTSSYVFTNVHQVVFNIFSNNTALSSIACGRITDVGNGNAPVYGATVTAKADGVVKATAKTDAKGIYALLLPPTDSLTTYTITAEAEGYINNQSLQVQAKKTAGERVTQYNGFGGGYSRILPNDDYITNSNSFGNDFEFSSLPAAADVTSDAAEEFEGTASVALSCATADAQIYYTLDGSDPFAGVSPADGATLYTGPITLSATATLKARATSDANSPSALFTRRFVKIGDIDDFFFRHDFSKGTRRFVQGTCSATSDILSGGATAARGPSGVPGTATQPAAAWGAFNSTDREALNGAWSIALHLNAPAVANGVLFSVGRARAAKQKDVIVCTSGDGTKLCLRHVTTTDSSSTKNDAGTDEIAIPGGTANGWHSLVLAFAPAESGSGAGTFKLYWDGALAGTGASTSGYFYGNDGGVQYSKPLSISSDSDLATFALTGLDANAAYAVRDMRFYSRDVTSIEAAAFEAACEEDRHADVPDLDAYAYVQSAGVNSVDTGYTAKGRTRFFIDFAYTEITSTSVFGWYSNTTPFHQLYINSNSIFAFRKGDTEVANGTNMTCNRKIDAEGNVATESKNADTERHVAIIHNTSANDKANANIKFYDYGDRSVYWRNSSGTMTENTLDAEADGNTHLFARKKNSHRSSSRVYSFWADETANPEADVAVPAAFLAPDVLPDGTAGYRNILTGEFRGESEDSPSTALAYVNGVGGASDYKYAGGVFSTRFWARSSDASKGGVKFAGQSAKGTNSLFTARLATATLTAEATVGNEFGRWEGDTWAIQNGAATDATITLKSDTAICLKAVFKEKAPAPTCADADAEGAVPMTLPGTLTLSVPTGATLYYTLDGSEPTMASASTTTGEIAIPAGTTTIKVFAAGGDWMAGDTATFTIRDAAAAIEDFTFRHDFSAGTYTAIKGSADLPAMNWTNYTNKAAFTDDAGDFAGYNPATAWGDIQALLAADWSVAVRVRQAATENGIIFGVGRANAKGTKEVALCSSSDPDKMSIATVVNNSGSYTKAAMEGEATVMAGFGDTTNGFHSIVLAFKLSSTGSGAGTFTLYFDGREMGTHETASANSFATSGIFQYCTLPSMTAATLENLGMTSMAGGDTAFLDMRFYDRALTQPEAAAYAAVEHPHKTPAKPDISAAAYVEAFGENYIDTLWKAPRNASFAADFAFTDKKTAQQRIFGIYNGDNTKFAEDGLVHGFYINGAATPKFAFVKASEFTSEDGGTWISTGVNADTARHRFTLEDADSTDAGSVGKLYNHGNATAVKTVNCKRVHAAAALRNTYIFACNKAEAADWYAKAKLYSFEASAGGTEPELHLAPVKLGDGKIGLRDTNTGIFYPDAAEAPAQALAYSDGIGRAADWKSERGYLYARFYAASATPAFGGVKFGDAGAAANTDTFVKRGESVQLEAVANEGYRFAEWQGDTWAIAEGDTTSATVSLKYDAPAALKAVFERDPVANTPDKFVEYIESTNGQYIDTGVEAKAGIYAEMGVAWTDNQSYNCFLGAKDTATSGKNVILAMRQTAWLFLRGYGTVSDSSYEDATLPTLTAGTFRDIKTEISPAGVWTATIDNISSVADFSESEGALDTGLTMYAFARHVNTGSGVDCTSKARCRYLRIWAWNADTAQYELKRWYRPCVKDGRAALYDEVSQFIFYSQSGADFAAGPDFDMMPDAFVQSYGASDSRATEKGNFIDTGIAPASDMTFKADYRFTETNAQDRAFGMRGGFTVNHYLNGSRCFAFCMSSKENWTAMKNPSNKSVEGNTNRHWIAMASATATLSQDARTNIVATTTDAKATATGEAERTIYLFDEHRGDTARHPGHVVLYTFIVEQGGAPVAFFAPARDATTGRAGMKNILTGALAGEGNANALSPLLYREGIGSADDYKYENETLEAKVYAKATEGGSITFDGGAAAGTGEFGFPFAWRAYGASTTLAAVPAPGFRFAGWEGDTWAIQNGGKATDRTIAVKSDTAMQFKAVFAKPKGIIIKVK